MSLAAITLSATKMLPSEIILLICENLSDRDKLSFAMVAKPYDSLKYQMTFHTPMALMKIVELPYYDRFSDILIWQLNNFH